MWVQFLFLFFPCINGTLEPVLQTWDQGTGLLFQPQTSAVFSATTWFLAFEVNVSGVTKEVDHIFDLYADEQAILHHNSQVQIRAQYTRTNETLWKAIFQLRQDTNQFTARLQGKMLRKVTKKKRNKKSLFPLGGHIMSFLYGTATHHDIRKIQQQIDTLFNRQDQIINLQTLHLTTFKEIEGQLNKHHQQLRQDVSMTASLLDLMNITMAKSATQPLMLFMWQRELLTTIGEVRETLHHYNQLLDQLQLGYLSLSLFPPEQLQSALENVQRHLPSHLGLAIGYNDDEILRYYQLPMAKPLIATDKIRGIVTIPLINTGQLFNVYRAIPFPTKIADNNTHERFIWDDSSQYFAVTSDHREFIQLGESFNTDVCVKHQPLICPAQQQAIEASQDHCLYQLFTGRLDNGMTAQPCQFRPYPSQEGVLQAVTEEIWAISVVKPTTLQISCSDLNRPNQPLTAKPDFRLYADHLLHLPRHCTATLEGKMVPLRLQLQSENNTTMDYQSSTDPKHLFQLYGESMENHRIADTFLNTLQKAYKRAQQSHGNQSTLQLQTALTRMAYDIKHIPNTKPNTDIHLIYGTISTLLTLIIIGYVIYLVKRKPCWKRVSPEPKINLTINFDDDLPHPGELDTHV
jgi:hypothetical protein